LLSDIIISPGRPVGIGAVIPCSLANHITVVKAVCPPGVDPESWNQAIPGRCMHLQLSQPDLFFTWQMVGVYQHVAERANESARALLCTTMEHVLKQTTANRHTLLIGDTNSAPSGGRWGYRPASYTKHADLFWSSRTLELIGRPRCNL
jgi:hypothetical protein